MSHTRPTVWFGLFRGQAEGATVLIVTHRLSIARHADVIHVMEHGRIVESGNHGELYALGGRYARSWDAQAQPAPSAAAE